MKQHIEVEVNNEQHAHVFRGDKHLDGLEGGNDCCKARKVLLHAQGGVGPPDVSLSRKCHPSTFMRGRLLGHVKDSGARGVGGAGNSVYATAPRTAGDIYDGSAFHCFGGIIGVCTVAVLPLQRQGKKGEGSTHRKLCSVGLHCHGMAVSIASSKKAGTPAASTLQMPTIPALGASRPGYTESSSCKRRIDSSNETT